MKIEIFKFLIKIFLLRYDVDDDLRFFFDVERRKLMRLKHILRSFPMSISKQ